jgi:hypothetical protein
MVICQNLQKSRMFFAFSMSRYNQSINDGPLDTLIVDTRENLLNIQLERYNLVLWRRRENKDITSFMKKVSQSDVGSDSKDAFKKLVRTLKVPTQDGALRHFLRKFSPHPGMEAFLQEYQKLYDLMSNLQQRNRSVLSIMDEEVKGYVFHQDEGYSMNWTIIGPPCIFVEEKHVKKIGKRYYSNPDDHSKIRQFPPHWIGIYKGRTKNDEERISTQRPFIHSRPNRSAGRRVLCQIYQ